MRRRLAENLAARERSVADKRHMEDAVATKKKLTEQIKQVPNSVSELEREIVKVKEAMADLNIKVKAAEKRA